MGKFPFFKILNKKLILKLIENYLIRRNFHQDFNCKLISNLFLRKITKAYPLIKISFFIYLIVLYAFSFIFSFFPFLRETNHIRLLNFLVPPFKVIEVALSRIVLFVSLSNKYDATNND